MSRVYNIDWLDLIIELDSSELKLVRQAMPKRRLIVDSITGDIERSLPEDMYYKTSSATTIKARVVDESEHDGVKQAATLFVSGNPAKAYQLYNLENNVSIEKAINQLMSKFSDLSGIKLSINREKVKLCRIDINVNIKTGCNDVTERIRQLKNIPLNKKIVDIYPNNRTARFVSSNGRTLARKVSIYDKAYEFEMTTARKINDDKLKEHIRQEVKGLVRVEYKYGLRALKNLGIYSLRAGIKDQLIQDIEAELLLIEKVLTTPSNTEVTNVMHLVSQFIQSKGQLKSAEMYYHLYLSMGHIPDRLKTSQSDRYRSIFRKIGIDIYRSLG